MIPDNVEKIIMAKEDYDRNVEQLLVEKLKLEKELQRKDNVINDLKSSIADYQEAVGDYQDEIVRKDNNWNELKEWCNECLEYHRIAREEGQTTISDTFFEMVLDKINELEGKNGS